MAAYVTSGARHRMSRGLIGLAGIALLGLTACGKVGLGGGDEMGWARASLERNDRLEIVATDPQNGTFTVRIKDTGELRVVHADQIIGSPPGAGNGAGTPSASAGTPATGAGVDGSNGGGSGAGNGAVAGGTGGQAADGGAAAGGGPAGVGMGTAGGGDRAAATRAHAGSAGGASGGETAAAGAPGGAAAPRTGLQPDTAPAADAPSPGSDVASITPGGRVLEAGPGYAIKMASKAAPGTARPERERSSTTTAAMETRHDPIVCQGARLLQIDNRNLAFDGDAVSAEDGCEIHITNSHITAKGVGVSVRAANVHIDNSQIEGDTASIDASDGAQVYASSSRFRGISRRVDNSSFHDLGGNVWN